PGQPPSSCRGGAVILPERVRAVADALLYEGYALYPYRASSLKNRQRWMLGSLSPRGVAEASGEPWRLRCASRLEGGHDAESGRVARFPRFEAGLDGGRPREAYLRSTSCSAPHTPGGARDEALPEEVHVGPVRAGDLAGRPLRQRFSMPGVHG